MAELKDMGAQFTQMHLAIKVIAESVTNQFKEKGIVLEYLISGIEITFMNKSSRCGMIVTPLLEDNPIARMQFELIFNYRSQWDSQISLLEKLEDPKVIEKLVPFLQGKFPKGTGEDVPEIVQYKKEIRALAR